MQLAVTVSEDSKDPVASYCTFQQANKLRKTTNKLQAIHLEPVWSCYVFVEVVSALVTLFSGQWLCNSA